MRSILYSKEMYEATTNKKNKTETRRTHGLKEINKNPGKHHICHTGYSIEGRLMITFCDGKSTTIVKSKYKKDEIVYIAEPMWITKLRGHLTALEMAHFYDHDLYEGQRQALVNLKTKFKKVSPMFMEQVYGRYFTKMVDISCERVQDITDEAILREGILPPKTDLKPGVLKSMYAVLFDKVNYPGAFDENPYVFVYLFEYLPNFKRRTQ